MKQSFWNPVIHNILQFLKRSDKVSWRSWSNQLLKCRKYGAQTINYCMFVFYLAWPHHDGYSHSRWIQDPIVNLLFANHRIMCSSVFIGFQWRHTLLLLYKKLGGNPHPECWWQQRLKKLQVIHGRPRRRRTNEEPSDPSFKADWPFNRSLFSLVDAHFLSNAH